eukprot:3484242-Pleurochrysis_carterae.AAC.1
MEDALFSRMSTGYRLLPSDRFSFVFERWGSCSLRLKGASSQQVEQTLRRPVRITCNIYPYHSYHS